MIKKDITIRFIPNILADEGRVLKSFPYNRDKTIRAYLEESGFEFKNMQVAVNGMNKIEDLNKHLTIGDEIVIFPLVEGPFAFLANPAFWQGVFTVVTVAATAYSVYSAITAQRIKLPTFNVSGEGIYEF